jgi:hypothetical protein
MDSGLVLMEKQEKFIKEFSYLLFIRLILIVNKYTANNYLTEGGKYFFNLNFNS